MLKFNFDLNEMQQQAKKNKGKNLIFSAPTGSGKTEAILLSIKKGQKVSYLLPTVTSCIFMFKRLCNHFHNIDVIIKTSILHDYRLTENPEFSIEIMCPDAPLIEYVKNMYLSSEKIAEKTMGDVVVLDELDNYPPMVKRVLMDYIKEFSPQTIIASATLDKELMNHFKNFKIISYKKDLKLIKHKSETFLNRKEKFKRIAKIIGENHDKKIGVILNSIRSMEEFESALFEYKNEFKKDIDYIFHHSQVTEYERLKNEEKLYHGDFDLCISNDCISFSVDINFDILFMDVSDKMNINIQRLGRNNRYNKVVCYKNLYLLEPGLVTVPPFISRFDAQKNLEILEGNLSYTKVNKMKETLEFEKIPTLEHILKYLKKKQEENLPLDLREIPYTFEIPTIFVETVFDPKTNKKVTKNIPTSKKIKMNGTFPWSWYPYESEETTEMTLVYLKGGNYKIEKQQSDGSFLVSPYYGYQTNFPEALFNQIDLSQEEED